VTYGTSSNEGKVLSKVDQANSKDGEVGPQVDTRYRLQVILTAISDLFGVHGLARLLVD
jgi:hypothetical protein